MTEMLNKEFSRKSFIKGTGGLVVGFSLAGAAVAGKAGAATPSPSTYIPADEPGRLVHPHQRGQHGQPAHEPGRDRQRHPDRVPR